ncbi:threonine synthase [bacterium CPR1]|nr:threonine synthase [bacterium CPR1]
MIALECTLCSKRYQPGEVRYVCPACGPDGLLDPLYDYERARGDFPRLDAAGIARYLSILPIKNPAHLPPLLVGGTPLTRGDRLARELGLQHLFLKEDNRSLTGSFKDRASAVAVAAALDEGERLITGASTGNAASSLAGMAAALGLTTVIFVPARAPRAKITQLLVYGAHVLLVDGSYDDACDLSLEATNRYGWYNRNTGYNPVCLEGKKTAALELWEDFGREAPEAVFVPVGDGCIIGGIGKGFMDLRRMGLIDRLPRLYGCQAEGSAVLSKCQDGRIVAEPDASTVADSICVGYPRAASQALRAVRESRGSWLVVTDEEILEAQQRVARSTGVFGEPACSAAAAGLFQAVEKGLVGKDERIALVVTGSGLKDVEGAMKGPCGQGIPVPRSPEGLEAALQQIPGLL